MSSEQRLSRLATREWQQVEQRVHAFEAAWQAGRRPLLADYLPAGPERYAALLELAHVELELRLAAGERARVEDYLAGFPELADNPSHLLDLIAAEFSQRRRTEPDLTAHEYAERFPQVADDIPRCLGSVSETLTEGNGSSLGTERSMRGTDARSSAETIEHDTVRTGPQATVTDIPGYEILGELGRGGMGVVYKAKQIGLKRIVALKMIRGGSFATVEERRRFRIEAEAIARLRHVNIVQVHDIGEVGGNPYFSLEYCDGGSLANALDGTPLPPRDAAALLHSLAHAMQAAHAVGIIHRDLKPANVLLQIADRRSQIEVQVGAADAARKSAIYNLQSAIPKITDFGLAKKLDEAGETASGAVMGTPSYMAPEQADGLGRPVGPAADVYALGAILYECLTGRPPFKAATAHDTMRQVINDEPVPVLRLQPSVPRDLGTICHKCLEKSSDRRYSSASALAEDLRRFQAGEPILARPAGKLERTLKWIKRRPLPAALIALSLVFVASLVIGSAYLWQTVMRLDEALGDANTERGKADHAKNVADAETKKAVASNEVMSRHVDAGNLRLLHQLWLGGNLHAMQPLLDRQEQITGAREPHGFLHQYLRRLAGSADARLWREPEGTVTLAAHHPDGQVVAIATADGAIHLLNRATQVRVKLPGHVGGVQWLSFLAGGAKLASIGNDMSARFWNRETGQMLNEFKAKEKLTRLAISRDGSLAAGVRPNGTVAVWETASGGQLFSFERDMFVRSLDFSPDGKTLAIGGVFFVDARTGKDQGIWWWHEADVTTVAYSPRGWFIAAGLRNGTVTLRAIGNGVSLHGGAERRLSGHKNPVRALAFTADEDILASGSDDTSVRLWDLRDGQVRAIYRHPEPLRSLSFSSDGQRLASTTQDGKTRVWDRAADPDRQELAIKLRPHGTPAYTADGKTLVVPCRDYQLALVEVARGRIRARLKGHLGEVLAMSLSADSATLATIGKDHSVRLWDLKDGRLLATHMVEDVPHSVALSPDGKLLAAGLGNGKLRWWETAGGKERPPLPDSKGPVTALAFAPDGKTLASGGAEPIIRLWDTDTGKPRPTQIEGTPDTRQLAFTADGKSLISLRAGANEVRIWDALSGKPIRQLGDEPIHNFDLSRNGKLALTNNGGFTILDIRTRRRLAWSGNDFGTSIHQGALSPDGKVLATTGPDESLRLWNWTTLQFAPIADQRPKRVRALAFAADGKTLFTGRTPRQLAIQVTEMNPFAGLLSKAIEYKGMMSGDRSVLAWDAATGKQLALDLPEQPNVGVHCLAATPDGGMLLAGGEGGAIHRWDLKTTRALPILFVSPETEKYWKLMDVGMKFKPGMPKYRQAVRALALTRDGRRFASGDDSGTVTIWDTAAGAKVATLPRKFSDLAAVAFAPDGRLAIGDGADVQLWDTTANEPGTKLSAHREAVQCLAYSRDGKYLASGGQDRRVILWDLKGGARQELAGHAGHVTSVAFSPDSQILASGGADGSVRLWHVASALEVANFEGNIHDVKAVAFSPDGNILAAGGETQNVTGEVVFWSANASPNHGKGGKLPR